MHRILTGLGGLILILAAGLYWPAAQPSAASEGRQETAGRTAWEIGEADKLIVHRPQPHPAIIATGQLLISLYALVAQQRPKN